MAGVILFAAVALAAAAQTSDPVRAALNAERTGRFAEAEQYYDRALKARPSNAELWQRLGLVRHLQNKFPEAILALSKAVQLEPKLWGSHLVLGIGLYKSNRFNEALQSLARAAELQPGHPETLFWQGAASLAVGRHLEGLRFLEQLRVSDPGNVEVLQLLASSYREYSISLWNDVAERHFDTAPGQLVHGRALEAQGAVADALAAFERAASLNPDNSAPWLAIGQLLLRQSKPAEAQRALRRAVDLGGPEAADARALLTSPAP